MGMHDKAVKVPVTVGVSVICMHDKSRLINGHGWSNKLCALQNIVASKIIAGVCTGAPIN